MATHTTISHSFSHAVAPATGYLKPDSYQKFKKGESSLVGLRLVQDGDEDVKLAQNLMRKPSSECTQEELRARRAMASMVGMAVGDGKTDLVWGCNHTTHTHTHTCLLIRICSSWCSC